MVMALEGLNVPQSRERAPMGGAPHKSAKERGGQECPCHVYSNSMLLKQILDKQQSRQRLQGYVLTTHSTLNSTMSLRA